MDYNPPTGGAANDSYVGKTASTQGSKVPPHAIEYPQRELVGLIAESLQTPSSTDLKQLVKGVRSGKLFTFDDTSSTANTLTIAPLTAHTALFKGLPFRIFPANTNTSTTVNVVVNAIASVRLKKANGADPAVGDIQAGRPIDVVNDGTNFRVLGLLLSDIVLTAARFYYVSTSGNDSNDGLTSGTAFATIQKAVNVANSFNLNGYNVTIQVADGAYERVVLPPINGSGTISLIGNTSTPYNCVITTSSGSAVVCSSPGYVMNGFRIACLATVTGDPGSGLWIANSAGGITMRNINWGTAVGAQMTIDGGQVILGGNQYSSGGAFAFAYVIAAGKLRSETNNTPTLTITTALTYSSCFLLLVDQALSLLLFASITGASSVTGAKYNVQSNSLLDSVGMGPSAYPGSIAGVTSTGGTAI